MSTEEQAPGQTRSSALSLWLSGLGFLAVVALITWGLSRLGGTGGYPSYTDWSSRLDQPFDWIRWLIGDTNEAQFYKSALAGLGMTAGALLAWALLRSKSALAGFPIAYGTGLIGWILAASWSSLILANLLWQWTINDTFAWQPTFVTFVSVPAAIILIYGGGWKKAITAAILGAVLTTPIAILVVDYVTTPLALPSVVGNVTGMWAGALIAFTLCKALPWMTTPPPAPEPDPDSDADQDISQPTPQTPAWLIRRALADFTEPQFYGNEWATLGLLLGAVLEFLLNPVSPAYGTGLLPAVIMAQFIAAVIGVLMYRKQWQAKGWYPTFIPIVSVAPAIVMTFGGSPLVIIVAGLLGASIAPPLGAAIGGLMPKNYHPFIGYVMAMTIAVAALIPILRVIPGFGA